MIKSILAASAISALTLVAACGDGGGSAEKAGENIDSAFEQATQGEENLSDGPMERAGENVDQATGTANENAADAVSDATDGNPTTNP